MAANGTKGQVITWMVGPAPSFKDAEKKAVDALKKGKDATEAELIEAKEALEKAKNAQSPLTMAEQSTRLSLHMSVTTNLVTLFNMSPTATFGNTVAKSWGVGSMAASGGGVAAGASKLPMMGPILSKTNSPFTPKAPPPVQPVQPAPKVPPVQPAPNGGKGKNGVVVKKSPGATDFVSEHAYKRHANDPNKPSTKSTTRYADNVDPKQIADETIKNPDSVNKLYDANGQHYATKFSKDMGYNISQPPISTSQSRVFINHIDPTKSTQFPFGR
jgi:hypothetical protein